MNYFLNITNHQLTKEQVLAIDGSCAYSTNYVILNVGFPEIDPALNASDVRVVCEKFVSSLLEDNNIDTINDTVVAHVMGEQCATMFIVVLLSEIAWCVHSTTKLVVKECFNLDGTVTKTSEFKFVRFRGYPHVTL